MKRSELIEIIRRVVQEKKHTNEAKIAPTTAYSSEEIEIKKNMITCLKGLREKTSSEETKKLNLKIGKYNASGEEFGVEMTWNKGQSFLSTITKRNAENLFHILNITPEKVYIGVVPTRCAYSFYITGTYNNNPIVIARKETGSSGAGQTYLITPNLKKQLNKFNITYASTDLEEAKVIPNVMGRLSKDIIKILGNLTADNFAEGISGFDLYEPISQEYNLDDYCNEDYYDPEDIQDENSYCNSIKTILKRYPNGAKFVSNDLFQYVSFAPGVPPANKYTELIEIDPKRGTIIVSSPYISDEGYNAGWFDASGKYYPDIKNISGDGTYIGDGGNIIEV